MAKNITIIEVEVQRGAGTEGDPCRTVTQFWTLDGTLICTKDVWMVQHLIESNALLEAKVQEEHTKHWSHICELDVLRQTIAEDCLRMEALLGQMGGKFTPKQKTAVNQVLGIIQSYARAWDSIGVQWPDQARSS